MRRSPVSKTLDRLPPEDLDLILSVARCRGAFTRDDYQKARNFGKSGAAKRLGPGTLFSSILKKMRPTDLGYCPDIFFPRRCFGRHLAPGYVEPETRHTLLDAYLRFVVERDLGYPVDAQWSHNTRQLSLLSTVRQIHLIDSLDRSEVTVLARAQEFLGKVSQVFIHTASHRRDRRMNESPTAPHVKETWERNLADEYLRPTFTPNESPEPLKKVEQPKIVFHKLLAFNCGLAERTS